MPMQTPVAHDRIIDRDIRFYEAESEFCADNLRKCTPRKEPYWQQRQQAAARVFAHLVAYRIAMDRSDL